MCNVIKGEKGQNFIKLATTAKVKTKWLISFKNMSQRLPPRFHFQFSSSTCQNSLNPSCLLFFFAVSFTQKSFRLIQPGRPHALCYTRSSMEFGNCIAQELHVGLAVQLHLSRYIGMFFVYSLKDQHIFGRMPCTIRSG